jgi:hypothetical protein
MGENAPAHDVTRTSVEMIWRRGLKAHRDNGRCPDYLAAAVGSSVPMKSIR